MADVPGKFYRATKVRTGVSPSSAGSIEGEPLPPVNPPGSSLNSVGLTMPSAFTVSNSPLTANGTIGVAGAGTVAQYIRGDGSLADFPETSGGGSSVSYYLNGSVAQGTIGGVAYKEMNKVPILGAGTDFTINANGYIASFITDAGDPNLLEIPGGNWNFETYFSASSGGGSPTFYVELYKVNSGGTATLIASNSAIPELIAFGTNITAYFTTLAVPTTTLALTDRLAVRYYVTHSGRTITLHTENNHLCQIITTFTTGLTALNGLTAQVQNFAVGTTGTDFNIASAVSTHTFNLPTASATNRGALSSADWALFTQAYNDKINSAAVTGTTTKTLTLTQQDGGTITASWSDLNTDAVLSVFGRTGNVIAVSGDYTTAQVTESGNLYYTDARSRAALSFAAGSGAYNTSTGVITIPTNNNQITNGAGYITSAALAGYLPLSGGVMTGPITTPNNTFGIVIGDDSRLADRNIPNTLFLEGVQNNDRGYINFSQTTGNALGAINGGDLTWRGNTVLTGSASAGQVAYWSSGSAITGESNLFWDATNNRLGINNSTPEASLDLGNTGGQKFYNYNGGSGNRNGLGLDLAGFGYEYSVFFAYGTSDNGRITFGSLNGTTYSTKMTILGNGNVNILGNATANDLIQVDSATIAAFRARGGGYGTLYNTSLRSIAGAIGVLQLGNNADNYILAGNTATGGFLSIRVNVSAESISSGTEAIRIFSNGRVFIGGSPSDSGFQFDVSGTGRFTSNLTANSFIKSGGTSSQYLMADGSVTTLSNPVTGTGTTNYLPKFTGSTTIGNSIINESGGNVNITNGNILNIYRTDNSRALQLYTTNNECVVDAWAATSEPLMLRSNGSGGRIVLHTNGQERLRITSDGVIGFNGSSDVGNASLDKMSMGYLNSNYGWIQTWSGTPLLLNSSGNNVLIGTNVNSGHKLTIQGGSDSGLIIRNSSGATRILLSPSGGQHGEMALYNNSGNATTYLGGNGGNNYLQAQGGNVGIGTPSPSSLFSLVKSSNSGSGSAFPRIDLANTLATQGDGSSTFNFSDIRISSGNSAVQLFLGTSFAQGTWEPQGLINMASNYPLVFRTNNTERLRIDSTGEAAFSKSVEAYSFIPDGTNPPSSGMYAIAPDSIAFSTNTTNRMTILGNGRVGIGTESPNRKLEVITGSLTTNGIRLTYAQGITAEGMDITYLNTGNTTTSFDSLYNSNSAVMQFRMKTAVSPVTAMTILGSGRIGIGTPTPSGKLSLGSDVGRKLFVYDDGGGANDIGGGMGTDLGGFSAETSIFFGNYGGAGRLSIGAWTSSQTYSTKLTVFANGNVIIGSTTTIGPAAGRLDLLYSGLIQYGMNIRSSHTDGIAISFVNSSGTQVGTIYQNGSSTAYNTSSDYRLKEDLKEFNGIDLINKIKTYDFKWKSDNSRSYGVVAHELQEVINYAVFGQKDSLTMQGVDYSKLVPILIKSIQELKQEIDILKN